MYDYIKGTLIEKRATEAIVEVSGLGYLLKISLSTYQNLPGTGEELTLKTYLHVREDILQLYGFSSEEERSIFNALITISGIGPKLAQTILSGLTPEKLVQALQQEDQKTLSSIAGVGKKTAQRLIVELKDKFDKLITAGTEEAEQAEGYRFNELEQEVLMALISLGYKRFNAEKAINVIKQNERVLTVEDYIKKALQVI